MRARDGVVALLPLLLCAGGCGSPRVNLITGTTIGLKATPGDGNTRPPQVTLGYRRAELAWVPTAGTGTTEKTDAASTLASFHFSTKWFGHTEMDTFVATGKAAQNLVAAPNFFDALTAVTLDVVPEALQQRRGKLSEQADKLTEEQAQGVLADLRYDKKPNKSAKESIKDYVLDATTDVLVERLEASFFRLK